MGDETPQTDVPAGPKEGELPSLTVPTEARRIAGELVKLHRDGAIRSERDASFYANLIRDLGATYAPQSAAASPQDPPPPGVYVPGKRYTPTKAQLVRAPLGLSREERNKFLQDDLKAAFQ